MAASDSYELVQHAKPERNAHGSDPSWRPGVMRQLPWTGLLSLLLGFGCGVAALTIALLSDRKPLDYWSVYSYSVQPTVILAI